MSSVRGMPGEVPETPQPNAEELREYDPSCSSPEPESAHEADPDYHSGPATPVKGSRKNKKRQHDASNEQVSDPSAKQQGRQNNKQQDLQTKRGQRSELGPVDNQSSIKKIKLNTGKGVDRIVEEINGGVNKLNEVIKGQRKEIDDLKNPVSNHHIAQLNAAIEELKEKNQELQTRKDELEDLFHGIAQDHDVLSNRLDKSRDAYQKVCDDEIRRKWTQLAFNIQNLCIGQLKTPPPKEASADEPDFMALIRAKPRNTHHFLQRYIWAQIHGAIFRGAGGIWCGKMSLAFNMWRVAVTEQCIKDPSHGKVYGHVKSETTHELFDILGIDVEAKNRLVDDMASKLSPLALDEDKCKNKLLDITDKAIALQTVFMRSKALFSVNLRDPGTSTKPGLTEEEIEREYFGAQGDNLYTVTPVLTKIGNADGHDDSYHGRVVVYEARVIAI
ncbi:unnamed protein product [Clonostachys rosea]|uniref:Uncharacterized protein n=1 Tax=Bionectria ochroleuca TaxID=29856 RepID=A0ABY6U7X1_BIOOC|nr:unnamed protein product [Clonostachys rosea]